jgi:hypothetical protein
MTRYAIDAPTAIRLVREDLTVAGEHQLVAPNVLRSQALSLLYRQTRRGELDRDEARTLLDGITAMKIRLLGDRVSRAVAKRRNHRPVRGAAGLTATGVTGFTMLGSKASSEAVPVQIAHLPTLDRRGS